MIFEVARDTMRNFYVTFINIIYLIRLLICIINTEILLVSLYVGILCIRPAWLKKKDKREIFLSMGETHTCVKMQEISV